MSEQNKRSTNTVEGSGVGIELAEGRDRLPAVIESLPPQTQQRSKSRLALLVVVLILGAGVGMGWFLWHQYQLRLPPGIAGSNGRLEADQIDIDTKFPGRIAKVLADEGDMVAAGQVVAMMDTKDLEASLKKSEALVSQAQRALDEAKANLVQQQTQVKLAQQELDRSTALVPRGFATVELLDQRRQQMNAAIAAEDAANNRVAQALHALDAASHDVELYRVNILDNSLIAPRDGPIEYRVANIGEMLPAGGKVFTMLDASYVYMDIYLPTAEAGRVHHGPQPYVPVRRVHCC
jgi:HlyD family secretion protein